MIAVSWGSSNVMRSWCALFLAASLVTTSSLEPARAAPPKAGKSRPGAAAPPADVETAEQLYQKLEYEQANATCLAVLKRRGLSHDELVRTYRILAVTYAVIDNQELAKETFIKLLAVEPTYEADPNLGPRVSDPFLEARGYFRAQNQKPGLTVEPQIRTDGGTIRVIALGPPRFVRRVVVSYRWGTSGAMNERIVPAAEGNVDVIKAPAGANRLDYFVSAQDENENAVMVRGSKDAPISVFAEAAPKGASSASGAGKAEQGRSIFVSPLFWILTGVVVAGGAVTAYYFLGPAKVAEATSVSLRPVLECGGGACR